MTTLTEHPFYLSRFTENQLKKSSAAQRDVVAIDLQGQTADRDPNFTLSQWRQGETPTHVRLDSVQELKRHDGWDLAIITAKQPSAIPDFPELLEHFDIPLQFVSGILQAVTHDAGRRPLDDQSYSTWVHFLRAINLGSLEEEPSEWLRSGVLLNCGQSPVTRRRQITLLVFQAPHDIWSIIDHLRRSPDWGHALVDPYLLMNMVFEAWYLGMDDETWAIVDSSREVEKEVFEQSSFIGSSELDLLEFDYKKIHNIAKGAMHLIEGVDAALRSLECVIGHHAEAPTDSRDGIVWRATHDALRHRRELFYSTRLRLTSIDQRLKNIINLAFNIRSMRDSRITREDSYVMKTLTVLAMVFLPLATISSIFGSQFFGTRDGDASHIASTYVTSQFWWLWATSVPATAALVLGWFLWIRNLGLGRRLVAKEWWMKMWKLR
ncbi:hypothetical protein F4778DRAFT_780840 [Xylariomycetidae sp. FL2044]|nr:hypothetical protein F4778DRAFT_780840 [Xylariomycetidae sp. FL2044]